MCFLNITRFAYCVFLHTGFPGVGISYCVCRNQKPRVLFNYTGLHRISGSLEFILCLSQSEASCIVFTQHCREWACHSVLVPTRSLLCCFLLLIGWSWPVIVCLPQSQASCIVLNAGLPGVGISLCVCHNQRPREMS